MTVVIAFVHYNMLYFFSYRAVSKPRILYRIYLHHAVGQKPGLVANTTVRKYSKVRILQMFFPIRLLGRRGMKKIAIFDQCLALPRKRHKTWPQLVWNANTKSMLSIEWRRFPWPRVNKPWFQGHDLLHRHLHLLFGVSSYQSLSAEAVETFGPMHVPIATKGHENFFVVI